MLYSDGISKRDHFDITYMLLFSANKRDKWITNLFYVTGNSFRIIDILIYLQHLLKFY